MGCRKISGTPLLLTLNNIIMGCCKSCGCTPCSCSSEPATCSERSSSIPSCLSSFIRYTKHKCYSIGDGIINLYCALVDIAAAIREYADRIQEKGYASGVILFSTEEGQVVDPNDEVVTQYSKSPFNNKILGIGVSTQDWNSCGGAYIGDSILEVRFWDFTSGAQIGNTLQLTSSSLHDKDTDEGNTISDNIFPGHVYGVKVKYKNTQAASCELPKLDFYIIVSPVDIITEE